MIFKKNEQGKYMSTCVWGDGVDIVVSRYGNEGEERWGEGEQ